MILFGKWGCNDTPKIHCKKTFAKSFAKSGARHFDGKNSINVILTEKNGVALEISRN